MVYFIERLLSPHRVGARGVMMRTLLFVGIFSMYFKKIQ